MAKLYIPGISGLLTEPNPTDSPSNTLSEAENIIVDQGRKVQSRHGLNINQDESTSPFAADSSEDLSTDTTFVDPVADINPISDSLNNYVHYSSFLNKSNTTFKLLEFKNSNDLVLTGLFVKQAVNQYGTSTSGSDINYLFKKSSTATEQRYYQISPNSGKLIQQNALPFDVAEHVFNTNLSIYLQTEQGITEANVDDMFRPTVNRFFPIRWPSFPKISHTLIQSSIYANWLPSNYKIGIRITFYREMGYNDKEGQIYESQPSSIYEIVNTGSDSIPVIDFDFLAELNADLIYKEWNDFSRLNNGRKFGIKIYRTQATPVGLALGADYLQCYEPIPFDKLITSKIITDGTATVWHRFESDYTNSLFRLELANELFNIDDRLSYILNNVKEDGITSIPYVFNLTNVKNYKSDGFVVDPNDIIPAKLKIIDKREYGSPVLLDDPTVDFFDSATSATNAIALEEKTFDKIYRAFEYKHLDYNSKYIEYAQVMFSAPTFVPVEVNSTTCTFINNGGTTSDYVDIVDSPFPNNSIIKFKLANPGDTLPSILLTTQQYRLSFVSINGNVSRYRLYLGTDSFPLYWTNNGTGTAIIYQPMFTMPGVTQSLAQGTSVTLATTGTLPTGLLTSTTYYVALPLGNNFYLSSIDAPNYSYGYSSNVIQNTTNSGTGVHRIKIGTAFPDISFEIWETENGSDGTLELTNKVATSIETTFTESNFLYTVQFKFSYVSKLDAAKSHLLVFSLQKYANTYEQVWLLPLEYNVSPDTEYRKVYGWTGNNEIAPLEPAGYTGLSLNFRLIRYVTQYEYQLEAINDIRVSSDGHYVGAPTLAAGSVLNKAVLASLVDDRYFIRTYNVELNLNDEALADITSPLYTNTNSDSALYTNLIPPKSQIIIPFKDFYIHAGPKKPLEASITVISQPVIEQHACIPKINQSGFYKTITLNLNSGNPQFTSSGIGLTNGNAVYFSTTPPAPFSINTIYYVVNAAAYPGSTFSLSETLDGPALTPSATGTATMHYQRWPDLTNYTIAPNSVFTKSSSILSVDPTIAGQKSNGELFFESAVTGPRRYQIQRFPDIFTTSPLPGHNEISYGYGIPDITTFYINNTILGTTNIDHSYLSNNVSFNITMFERPYLTLRLISTDNVSNDVVIQTEPLYNRRGYYALKNDRDEFDDNALTYDLSLDEMNAFTKSSGNLILRRGLDNIYHVVGERAGQVSADGVFAGYDTLPVTVTASSANITLNRHNLNFNDTVEFVSSAPTGFSTNTKYYVKIVSTNTFQLSLTSNGTSITPTSGGTFQIKLTTPNRFLGKWINDSTSNIYFNKDTNELVIKNMGNIDIKRFESPGIIMIQSSATEVILFTYSSIDTSTAAANSYTFKSVAIQFISRNKYPNEVTLYDTTKLNEFITQQTNYFSIAGPTHLFFLKGSSVDNLPIYPYAKENYLSDGIAVGITINSSNTQIIETYTPTDTAATNPTFTLLPHRKKSDIEIGTFNRSKNYSFLGLNRKDAGEYLDLYATQIINKFNIELQKKGIKAYLRKGPGIGEIIIIYPDGQSIQMMNGKHASGTDYIYPGKHTFLPELNKLEFIELAKKEQQDIIENNQALVSRRGIPEITPVNSTITVGNPNKKFIAAAQNSDDLYIFKEDGIFRIIDEGDVTSNVPLLSVTQFSVNLICQAAGSVKEINDEIIFLSQYGFMSISGGSVQNISGAIEKDILLLLSVSPKHRIRSFVNETKQMYYCTLINESDSTLRVKSGTYVFNIKTRQWSFMDHEILDGFEDSNSHNLVAYRQKAILGTSNGTSSWTENGNTHHLVSCDLSYPMQITDYINNFYVISRERHTDNIPRNAKDQYDYISENLIVDGSVFTPTVNGFTIEIPVSKNAFIFHYAQKLFKMFTPPTTINVSGNQYAIVDSPIQMVSNREIYVEMTRVGSTVSEIYASKLTKFEYTGTTSYAIKYTFEYLTSSVPVVPISLQSLRVIAGIPVKITFNPESSNAPDTNKLFQEYMLHTETYNKGAAMAFKTDSRANFSNDRTFRYDASATNRNVFRTYIPTTMSRGRYLIRQVKHDVPLENLIITGQTMVMRDSRNTRVQKNGDDE